MTLIPGQNSFRIVFLLPVLFLLSLHTLVWPVLSYWSLWPPLPSPAVRALFPCDSGADPGLLIFLLNVLELLSLLSDTAAEQRVSFSEAEMNVLTGGFTPTDFSLFEKNPGSFFPAHPLVWFISTSVKTFITHGCIPKHSDQDHHK